MSDARNRILKRLGQAGGICAPAPLLAKQHVETPDWSISERTSRFVEKLSAARTEVVVTTTPTWTEGLRDICVQNQINNLLMDVYANTGRAIAECARTDPDWPELKFYQQDIEVWKDELFDEVEAAFTVARAGIVETGSLIVCATQTEPRLASVVPPLHIVLLSAASLYTTFAEAIDDLNWQDVGIPPFAQIISAVAKSPDLEQFPMIGVQGQEALIVLLVA